METKQAFLNPARISLSAQLGGTTQLVDQNLQYSQFRHDPNIEELSQDSFSYIAYPIMESFRSDANVGAVLATPLVWRLLLTNVLQYQASAAFDCIIENSFNQTLMYRVLGPTAEFMGDRDFHDRSYDHLKTTTNSIDFARGMQDPSRQSYTFVSLNTEYGWYSVSIYPTKDTESTFITNTPWVYAVIVAGVATFLVLLFAAFVYLVEQRHRIVMEQVIRNAALATAAERDLNEYLAHEVRNPLASAILAHGFTTSALEENPDAIPDETLRNAITSDQKIVEACLLYVDEFLKSMLLMYRAAANKLDVNRAKTNILAEILDPVGRMISPTISKHIEVLINCPGDLNVIVDRLRLEQIILQLCWNAAKFTKEGFIRLKAYTNENGHVEVSVEDSGPGIPIDKRSVLFQKYHTNLQVVTQGNGIGLSLCKSLANLLDAKIWLDETYHSGIAGSPGVRFALDLYTPPALKSPSTTENCQQKNYIASETNRQDSSINAVGPASSVSSGSKKTPLEDIAPLPGYEDNDGVEDHQKSQLVVGSNNQSAVIQSQKEAAQLQEEGTHFPDAIARPLEPPEQTQEPGMAIPASNSLQTRVNGDVEPDNNLPEYLSILFVDDDKMLRKLFGRAVRKICPGWNVQDCACGEDALEILERENGALATDIENQAQGEPRQRYCGFDIIFIDQYMSSTEPRMLGTELVVEIRSRGFIATLCGLSANDLGKDFKDAGADFFLCKPLPFKPDPLKQALSKLIS